ncbi:MAG: hypothetical protein AAB547_03745 [Patescibacteria group bacterium]
MKTVFHQNVSDARWREFSLVEQMANIGSEVERALRGREKNNPAQSEAALYRGLELFDMTLEDPKNFGRLKEVARSRELFLDYFIGENIYRSTKEAWQKYFLDFAIAARR